MRMVQLACLACPEGGKRFGRTRGLCHACYQTALKEVNSGATTWAALAKAGKARLSAKEMGVVSPRAVIDFRDMPERRPRRGY